MKNLLVLVLGLEARGLYIYVYIGPGFGSRSEPSGKRIGVSEEDMDDGSGWIALVVPGVQTALLDGTE